MAYKMFSTGLVLALAGMCLCQQQQASAPGSQYQQQQSALSQASFQIGSAATQQTKLEDIERDSLTAAAYGQKTQQQPAGKSSPAAANTAAVSAQQPQQPQAYQTVPPQQYYVQPYPAQQQQFYVQPYQAQPYQAAFDYAGVQYMFINPNANQVYQPYYVPAVPQPSAVPQYVTKQSSQATKAPAQQEYKLQQQYAATQAQAQQEYKQQQYVAAPSQAQQQQYVQYSAPAYQYVQQPAAPSAAAPAPAGSLDFSYVTRHPAAPAAQYKAQAPAVANAAVQPQQYLQYDVSAVVPQQQQVQYQQLQQQQPQYYYTVPASSTAEQQPATRVVQQSAKSQYSSGVKSTTPSPVKESFAYKFESSPVQQQQQQQPSGSAYSTLRFSA